MYDERRPSTVPYDLAPARVTGRVLPTVVQAQPLKDWCIAVFEAVGLSHDDAVIMSHVLVETDLLGVDTHGVLKVPMYVRRAREGGDNPRAQFKILRESATTARVDADGGYGQVAGWKAMGLAVDKAAAHDVGFVSVFNSNTLTAARIYTMRAAEKGMIGICVTNGCPVMPPPGGQKRLVGTNPWSIAVPGGDFPVVMDSAVTTVPRTRLALAAMRGEPIPSGWATDAMGNPTTDLAAAINGMLLPMGGHKGYAWGVMADLLTGVLAGDRMANEVTHYGLYHQPTGVSHLLGAIRVDAFIPLEVFRARVAEYVRRLTSSPRTPAAAEILVPGQRSYRTRQQRSQHGIPLHRRLAENLLAVADELSVPFPAGSIE